MRADSIFLLEARRAGARAFCGALLLVVGGNALSLPGRRFVGQYDFGYAIRGDKPARPAQVFDDGGGKVYFEARPNQPMPAVFAGSELTLLVMQPEGQYFTARTAASEFTLVLGGARAVVRRGDAALGEETVTQREDTGRLLATATSGLVPGIDYGAPPADAARHTLVHEQPVVFAPGVATLRPEVLDALSALVVRIGHDVSISVFGRNDAGDHDALAILRGQALRNALLARGLLAPRIHLDNDDPTPAEARSHASVLRWRSTEPGSATTAIDSHMLSSFDIAPDDQHIAGSLRRWAHANGYGVAWDLPWVAPITGSMRVDASSFPEAVQKVVSGLRAQGYPVQARVGADRVARFTSPE